MTQPAQGVSGVLAQDIRWRRPPSGRLICDPPGPECHETLSVGALVAGIWDWRSLIAVGAAVIILYVALRAMQPESASRRLRDWQVVTVLATATALPALAAVVVDPVSVPATGARLGLDSALSYGAIVGLAGALVAVIGGLMLWRSNFGSIDNRARCVT